ncbi:MAG: DNA replication and repair protein RecF [Cyclobacteriaceae bacterium]
MVLSTLKLVNFKNYREETFQFKKGISCLLGLNGMGKTNLLDAIHYLCMTRSSQSNADQENILFDQPYFSIIGEFDSGLKVNCYFESGKKKIFKVNGKEPEKLSDHIGSIPCVLTTPDDNELIREGSEVRRKLFDRVISQYDHHYLEQLIQCRKLLNQRNSYLKQNEGKSSYNKHLLGTYDEQLIPLFISISSKRNEFLEEYRDFFTNNYHEIFKVEEIPAIRYRTKCLDKDFERQFKDAVKKDLILERTTMGSHKDDFVFLLDGKPTKKFGSQGQQKSLIIALKLSEFDFLKAKKDQVPLLLLDDIFDKLDDHRISHLVKLLTDGKRFSQVFISDARKERTKKFFEKNRGVAFYEIENGHLNG